MLTRRKESDTYLVTVSRHRWSRQITMKIDKIVISFSTVAVISSRGRLMKATVLAESYNFIYFDRDLSTPAMSTDSNQVGVTLFPSC